MYVGAAPRRRSWPAMGTLSIPRLLLGPVYPFWWVIKASLIK